jgi:hypothetical protein
VRKFKGNRKFSLLSLFFQFTEGESFFDKNGEKVEAESVEKYMHILFNLC